MTLLSSIRVDHFTQLVFWLEVTTGMPFTEFVFFTAAGFYIGLWLGKTLTLIGNN